MKPRRATNVLLSIEPDEAESILDGSKRWEYRRVAPKEDPPIRFVLYATAPVQAAVGVFWSFESIEGGPDDVVEATIDETDNDRDEVLEYLRGGNIVSAIRVDTFCRFDESVSREWLASRLMAPSQNFRYLKTVPYREAGEDQRGVV